LPVGAYGVCIGDRLELVATVVSPEGDRFVRDCAEGSARDAVAIGTALGDAVRAAGGAEIVEEALRRG
jgi:porphobilinogen deaminase